MDLRESRVTEMIQRAARPKWVTYNNHNIKCFSEGDIREITNNFGHILGEGSFGKVYKGVLKDDSKVAVKKFKSNVRNIQEIFAKELKVHSEINHKNVVRLIGYCAEENALMIVIEYVSQGNLDDVLHHHSISIVLDTRLRIAVECSEALSYLHSHMYTHVIHGDIKPANILLDDNFNAKISDFGISRLVNTEATLFTEHVIGSIGYMDPLFARDGRLTSKSDVYSFGIVLLELIVRKKASHKEGGIGIVECFTKALAIGIKRVRELFDIEISSQNNMKILDGVAKLAGECLMMERDKRPEMVDVVERLRTLRKTQAQGDGRHFSLEEMKSATRNFDESHLAGSGAYGELYYGVIDGGATWVAIRRCRAVYRVKKFETEIVTMTKLRHDHLVSLVGYCKDNNKMVLVYEYMAGGTLHGRLHGCNTEEPPLTWRQRLEICTGAARALHYLHECSIIHDDLTTKNIFLDDRLVAKVSCPISPIVDRSMSSLGMYGYIDPAYMYSMKSDVYSFGVMLIEVLCARPLRDPTLPTRQEYLLECALNCKKKGILDLIVDPYLEGKIAPRCFNKFTETAEKCVASDIVDRPSMREVLQNLEMCLVEQSGDLGDKTLGDDGTNRPSMGEHRRNLEKYLSDESGRYGSEFWRR